MGKREVVTKMISLVDGGKSVVAAYLGMSETKFNNHLYETKGSRFFSVDELEAMQTLSQSNLVAEYFADKAGCMVITKMKPEQLENFDLYMLTLETIQASGELSKLIKDSIADDGVIDENEEALIRKLTEKVAKNIRSSTENAISLHKKSQMVTAIGQQLRTR